jgi:hypothetical protein
MNYDPFLFFIHFCFFFLARDVCGFDIKLGASLSNIPDISPDLLNFVCNLSTDYLVLPCYKSKTINVIFHHEVSPPPLKSYFHAVTLGLRLDQLLKKVCIDLPYFYIYCRL